MTLCKRNAPAGNVHRGNRQNCDNQAIISIRVCEAVVSFDDATAGFYNSKISRCFESQNRNSNVKIRF